MKKVKIFLNVYKYYFILITGMVVLLMFGFVIGRVVASASEKTTPDTEVVTVSETRTEKTSLGEFKLTAYCTCSVCCGKYADGITATGTEATVGRTVAVDPDVIPYGSKIEINGHIFVAEDCGGLIKGNHIDILFPTHEIATEFGVQNAEVFIITE